MAEKKIYCGSGKKQKDGWLKCTINPDKLKDFIQEYEGNKYVKIDINIYDKPNQFGKDVSISIDTYKKEDVEDIEPEETETEESLPF